MKKSIMLVAFVVVASLGFAQKKKSAEVPNVVKDALRKQFPAAQDIKWDKENGNYQASFDLNKVDNSVLIDGNGKILETEIEIKMSEMPKGVSEYVKANYKGMTIKEAAKLTDAAGVVTYEVEVKGMDLIFDQAGKFLKESKD